MDSTQDAFLGGRINLHQPVEGYRAGIDPLFLAASVNRQNGQKILDVGVGVGTAALALANRCPDVHVTGIEIQGHLVDLAHRNIVHNSMGNQVSIVHGDILNLGDRFESESFDQVITNPPYYEAENFKASPHPGKAQANVESHVGLEEWLHFCVSMLRPKGTLTLIHRAEKGCEAMGVLRHHIGNVIVFPLWPTEKKPALRVIIQGKKGVKGNTILHPGLVLHRGSDKYSPEAEAVLRHGQSLDFDV